MEVKSISSSPEGRKEGLSDSTFAWWQQKPRRRFKVRIRRSRSARRKITVMDTAEKVSLARSLFPDGKPGGGARTRASRCIDVIHDTRRCASSVKDENPSWVPG